MPNHNAPIELAQLGLDPHSFTRSDNRSWRGACPRCGGHRRFVVFTDKPFPNWNHFCDGCGLKGWAKDLNIQLKQEITESQRREWRERNEREAAQQAAQREKRLAEFTTRELWEELHARLDQQHRAWWRAQGIPDDLQDFWHLGYERNHIYETAQGKLATDAYTIPYFHFDGVVDKFQTMQYRLQNPLNPNDRYRFAHGLKATYFDCYPYEPISGQVIICEGAKKAMVVTQLLPKFRVIAMPSKSGDYGIADAVKDAEHVFILLDPDGLKNAYHKALEIGKRAVVVDMPQKIDDAILFSGLSADSLLGALKAARH